jgi:hypothetical protein
MAIATIRERLGTTLGAISGVRRVFPDIPDIAPAQPDMPCFILNMREPMVTVQARNNTHVDFTWHFDLTCLTKSEGLGNPAQNTAELESYIASTVAALFADYSGGGAWTMINKDAGGAALDFTGGVLTLEGQLEGTARAWGFSGVLDVTEFVAVTMSSGT